MARLQSVLELVRFRADNTPNEPSFTLLLRGEEPGATLTFAELDQAACAVATTIREHVPVGARAILLYPAGLEFLKAFLGCLYANVIAVPAQLNPTPTAANRVGSIIADCGVSLVLSTDATLANSDALRAQVAESQLPVLATDLVSVAASSSWKLPSVDFRTVALLQYTSGSTSTPRGVVVTHGNLLDNLNISGMHFGSPRAARRSPGFHTFTTWGWWEGCCCRSMRAATVT
jgi:acyl-CoA synthetase (AMP-forming)/AMP-acid ligase II